MVPMLDSEMVEASLGSGGPPGKRRILFLVCEDWLFVSFRLPLAKELVSRGWSVGVGCRVSTSSHAESIRKAGIDLFDVPFGRETLAPAAVLQACLSVRKLIRDYRPDLVHLVALRAILVGWMGTIGTRRAPFVNAVTGLGSLFAGTQVRGRLRLARAIVELLFRRVFRHRQARNVFQNREDLDYFVSHGLSPRASSHLIRGSGVDTRSWRPRPEPQAGAPVVLFAGRILRDKGVTELIEASRMLRQRKMAHHLRLIGEPDPCNPTSCTTEQVQEWVQEGDGSVEWLGWREDVLEQMTQAHVVVLPSYREGLPKVLLEAGVAERAVVTSDAIGCRELVRHEVNGLLTPPRNAPALAGAIERLLDDEPLRRRLAEAHRKTVCEGYSAEIVHRQYIELYEQRL